MHYEEKRKLKIAMLEEYDREQNDIKTDSKQLLGSEYLSQFKK